MAYLSLKGINKIYPNGFHAVHDFNLDIEKGEFIVFVGSSGCGKSTTLRMIAGLEDISSGQLLINGQYANDKGPREREVAMVFQSYALYPQMSVYDNLAFGLTLQGVDEDVIEEKVTNVARILGLIPAFVGQTGLTRTGGALATFGAIGVAVVIYLVLVIALRAVSRDDVMLMPKGEKIAKLLRL